MIRTYLLAGAAVPCLLLAIPAGAQSRDANPDERTDATIVVTGQRDPLKLNDQAQAGSRLGLTIRETPASVEVLTQDDLQVRGLRASAAVYNWHSALAASDKDYPPCCVSLA